jgi:ribosome biogenesis GTPase
MMSNLKSGIVVRSQAGFYAVRAGNEEVVCKLRGRLKELRLNHSLITVGDLVEISTLADGSGMIEIIQPRKTEFFRMAPTTRGEFKQVLLANPGQVLLVFACASPAPSLRMLDRFLVITEKQAIPAVIVANKVDLVGIESARKIFDIYSKLGYKVIYASAKTETGITELRSAVSGKISALSGPSGVGKSSLINKVEPGLLLNTGEVKETQYQKGKHTTVVRELYPLTGGGFIADMPGLRSLSLWDTQPEELDGYFLELKPLVHQCQFNNCKHISEPGCAVKAAVEAGQVSHERYESYLRLRAGDF